MAKAKNTCPERSRMEAIFVYVLSSTEWVEGFIWGSIIYPINLLMGFSPSFVVFVYFIQFTFELSFVISIDILESFTASAYHSLCIIKHKRQL